MKQGLCEHGRRHSKKFRQRVKEYMFIKQDEEYFILSRGERNNGRESTTKRKFKLHSKINYL